MKMTIQEKRKCARQMARRIFETLHKQGNRFYVYQTYYYYRIDGGKGWLVDFEDRDEIFFELKREGLLNRPWTQYKRIITDELVYLAMPLALPVNTSGVNWDDFANMGLTERMRAEEFVNACDEQNTYKLGEH